MFSDKSLLWLLSAVNEVKTTRTVERTYREGEKRKEDSWPGRRTYCITAVFNKRHSSIDLSGGNFSKHPAELKDRWNPCAGLIEGFLFKHLMRTWGEKILTSRSPSLDAFLKIRKKLFFSPQFTLCYIPNSHLLHLCKCVKVLKLPWMPLGGRVTPNQADRQS